MFDNVEDPFERLESLEIVQLGQGLAMTDLAKQIQQHSILGVKISESLIELVHHIDVLNSRVIELESKLRELETK
jgi:uncharacterized coiled-coil protein SlyX